MTELIGRAARLLPAATGLLVLGAVTWATLSAAQEMRAAASDVARASWTVLPITLLHLVQLGLSALAWRRLVGSPKPDAGVFFVVRLIRESVNSLLPVAHVGGDIVGIRLLGQRGVALTDAAASVVVDLTLEIVAQILFLIAGVLALIAVTGAAPLLIWAGSAVTLTLAATGLVAAQRFGLLRLLEAATRGIGRHWPALPVAALAGLNEATIAIYRRPAAVACSVALHALSWALGALETWLILRALHVAATPLASVAVESLGMAARSAGFAIPGALAIQEGGFVLAAAAVGIPASAALAVSLVKRLREVVVGLAGLGVWARLA